MHNPMKERLVLEHNHSRESESAGRLPYLVMGISLAMSGIMLAGKLTAYYISGSTAILSDAAESVIHGVATGVAFYSLWFIRQPADPRHPYGHEKMGYISAGFEGGVIFVAGAYILYQAVFDLIRGPDVHDLGTKTRPIEAGMVLTVEPGIYIEEERMGIRIENNIWITKNGHVDLMKNIPIEADDIERLMRK